MKKYLFLTVLVSLALVLSACTPQAPAAQPEAAEPTAAEAPAAEAPATEEAAAPESDEFVIGFSGAALLDEFQISLANGIKDEAEELGVKLIHVENDNDPVKQASDIEDLLAQDIDLLIITAASADAIVPSVEKANEMNIPVMMVDQGSNGGEFISHNGNDNYCMGYRGMEYVIEMIGDKGKVMHITGVPGTMIVNWNADAVKSMVALHPDVTLVEQSFANWDAQQAQAKTEDVLTAHPDLAGIYIHSEVMTPGVIQALKARDLLGKVKIVSGGFDTGSQEWLKNGEIQGAIQWDSYEGGRKTLKSAYDYLKDGTVPPKWNPWVVYINLAGGEKPALDCPAPDWSPFPSE